MKNLIIGLLFLFPCLPAFGQTNVSLERIAKLHSKFNVSHAHKAVDGSLILFGNIKRQNGFGEADVPRKYSQFYSDFAMYKIDANGEVIKRFRDKMVVDGKRVFFESVSNIGGSFYLFFSFNNTKKKKNYLFSRKIDIESLRLTKEIKQVAKVGLGKSKYFFGEYKFLLSESEDELLITYSTDVARVKNFFGIEYLRGPKKKTKRKISKTFNSWVYNSDMNLVQHFNKVRLRNNDSIRTFSYGKSILADYGVAVIAQNRAFRVFDFRTIKNRKFALVYYKNNGDTLYHFPKLNIGNITDLVMVTHPFNGNIVLGGPYTITGKGGNGIYMVELDKRTLKPVYEIQKPFKKIFIDAFDFSADSLKKLTTLNSYSYLNLYRRSIYGSVEIDNLDDFELDDFGKKKEKKRKKRKKRKADEKAKKEQIKKELELLKNDNNSIPVLSKAVDIFFNSEGRPSLLMEKQTSYTRVVPGGTVYNSIREVQIATQERIIIVMKGYGDAVIATLLDDTTLAANYVLKFNGISENPEHGIKPVQEGDDIFIQYGDKMAVINLNTLAIQTHLIPYFNKNFKKYLNKSLLSVEPLKYFQLMNGNFIGIENRRRSRSVILTID